MRCTSTKLGELSSPNATDLFRFSLDDGDTFIGPPLISTDLPGVTISEVSVNSADTTVGNRTYPPGTLCTFRASTAATTYYGRHCNLSIRYATTINSAVREIGGLTIWVTDKICA